MTSESNQIFAYTRQQQIWNVSIQFALKQVDTFQVRSNMGLVSIFKSNDIHNTLSIGWERIWRKHF